jgi:Protein-glutamine gamma-glutamyltransferase
MTSGSRHLTFQSKASVTASQAIDSFRTGTSYIDCLMGIEMVVLTGVRLAFPADFDRLHPVSSGRPAIQGVGVPVNKPSALTKHLVLVRFLDGGASNNPSNRFTVNDMVPGDYAYIQNRPGYESIHPGGGWNGENAINMGRDQFYGLGLSQGPPKSEAQLRQDLVDAYNDGLWGSDTRRAQPSDIRWTVLGAPVLNGDGRQAGYFVR